jgi:hypothetical protein
MAASIQRTIFKTIERLSRPYAIGRSLTVQALPELLSGLEEGDVLLLDVDRFTGPRVAADPRRPALDRERAEAAQLDTIATLQRRGDLVEARCNKCSLRSAKRNMSSDLVMWFPLMPL